MGEFCQWQNVSYDQSNKRRSDHASSRGRQGTQTQQELDVIFYVSNSFFKKLAVAMILLSLIHKLCFWFLHKMYTCVLNLSLIEVAIHTSSKVTRNENLIFAEMYGRQNDT